MLLRKSQDSGERAVAAGLLQTLTTHPTALTTMMENKPAPIPILWAAIQEPTTSLAAAVMGVLRNVVTNLDYKRILQRYIREADFTPLVRILYMFETLPSCGGRQASADCAALLEVLTRQPDPLSETPSSRRRAARALTCRRLPAFLHLTLQPWSRWTRPTWTGHTAT